MLLSEVGAKFSDYAVASNGFIVARLSLTITFFFVRFFYAIDDVRPFRID